MALCASACARAHARARACMRTRARRCSGATKITTRSAGGSASPPVSTQLTTQQYPAAPPTGASPCEIPTALCRAPRCTRRRVSACQRHALATRSPQRRASDVPSQASVQSANRTGGGLAAAAASIGPVAGRRVCAEAERSAAASAPGSGSAVSPHLRRDCAQPALKQRLRRVARARRERDRSQGSGIARKGAGLLARERDCSQGAGSWTAKPSW
jgi:hypothetical protein